MDRFHLIRHPLGGSDVYDSSGKQVGYSLPSVFGDGEDFYDMDGNPVGQSFESVFGGEGFMGMGNGSAGYMDEEILMGRNAWLNGDPFGKEEEPELSDIPGMDREMPGLDDPFASDAGDEMFSDTDWDDGGF